MRSSHIGLRCVDNLYMTDIPNSAEPAVEVRGLRLTYPKGVVALDGLDLTIPRGGVHGLLGPNGSGKSTTLRALVALLRADAGTIRILGHAVPRELSRVIDRVGVIIEEPRFFPNMSAYTNLSLLGIAIGVPREHITSALAEVGLAGEAKKRAKALSLGMKQRLAIASTLLKNPDLYIFDEPTNGLDPAGIHAVRETIRALAADGRTVVVSSHNLAEVQQIADTVSIIGRGKLLHEGPVSSLLTGRAQVRVRLLDQQEQQRGEAVLSASGYVVARQGDALIVSHPQQRVDSSAIARVLGQADLWPSELISHADTLEDAFLALTADVGLDRTNGSAA